MIGDTHFDMMMARAAGVPGIGVSWGYHSPAELSRAGASAIVHDFPELVSLLLSPTRMTAVA
jgi:phosphoglycolate phosphatase